MKLNEIYRSILSYAGLDADADGYIFTKLEDRRDPAIINGLRLVLPTEQQLRAPNNNERMIFHPLTENILRGESEVIVKLTNVLSIRLNFTIGIVVQSLLSLITSPDQHGLLTPDQSELLLTTGDADEDTLTRFSKLMINKVKAEAEKMFVSMYLKRGGSIRGKRHARIGVIDFRFYEELKNFKTGTKIGGIDLRPKDVAVYKSIMEFIFPNIDTPEAYNYGSDSQTAPYLDALMNTSVNVASRLNDVIDLYGQWIDEADHLRFDASWVEYFENLDSLIPEIRRVPVQAGNEGRAKIADLAAAAAPAPQAPAPTLPVPQVTQPQTFQPAPMPQATQQPVSPLTLPRQEVKSTGRGLDFQSLRQANPAIAFGGPNPLQAQINGEAVKNWMQQQQQLQQQYQQAATMIPMQTPAGTVMMPMQPQFPMQQPVMAPQMVQQPQMVPMQTPNGVVLVPVQSPMPMQQPVMQPQGSQAFSHPTPPGFPPPVPMQYR